MKLKFSLNQRSGIANPFIILVALISLGAVGYYTIASRLSSQSDLLKTATRHQDQVSEVLPNKAKNLFRPSVVNNKQPIQISELSKGAPTIFPSPSIAKPQPVRSGLFGQSCEGSGVSKLKTFPIDIKNIELIVPMGRVQDSHVTPTDHQYIIPVGTVSGSLVTDNPKKYSIKAPADGNIIIIELFKEPVESQYRNQAYSDNYLVVFEHSCDLYTRLIHIDTLSERILASFSFRDPSSQHPYASMRIPVKEGEIIGTVGPHSFDFQIMDANVKDKNLISPQNIDNFSAYTVDTFDYLADSLRGELLFKNLTKTKPLGGRIGYDIPGTLAGNWFLTGRSSARENYWTNNLSIVYDHLDLTQIRVSLGNFGGYPKAFGVVSNAPDPSRVGVGSGLIKYELTKFDYYSGANKWDGLHFAENLMAKNNGEVAGVVLFELVDVNNLKVEVFPGQTGSQVSGFTGAALLYER